MQEFSYKLMEDGNYCVTGYQGDEAEVTIPATHNHIPVTVLFDGLFSGHSEITAVHIPDSVTDMGEFLFDGCVNLHHLDLPAGLTSLWGYTFVRCGLEEIVLPDGVASLPPFAFKDCKQLKKVVCGAGMKKIYAWVFGGCDQLTDLVHGPDVWVSPEAFQTKILNT